MPPPGALRRSRLAPALIAAALVAAAPSLGAAPPAPSLQFESSPAAPGFGTVAVAGLDPAALARLAASTPTVAEWQEVLAVRVAAGEEVPPVLGRYQVTDDVVRFVPRFPLAAGIELDCRFDGAAFDRLAGPPAAGTPTLAGSFVMPEPPPPAAPTVVAVYPSAERVPQNLLRLYVHFSQPMRRWDVAERVRLLDRAGASVPLPFVEIEGGLWDPLGRRLTLFFHPGRVKRGVGPHRELGPPLRQGERYRLVIAAGLRSAGGGVLEEPFIRELLVGPPDRQSPDPLRWRIVPPAGATGSLAVELGEPLDHGQLLRLIEVVGDGGAAVAGEVTVTGGETRWWFTPDRPWLPGRYQLRVDPRLEDLAGNSVGRRFEEPPGSAAEPPAAVVVPFEVGEPAAVRRVESPGGVR